MGALHWRGSETGSSALVALAKDLQKECGKATASNVRILGEGGRRPESFL